MSLDDRLITALQRIQTWLQAKLEAPDTTPPLPEPTSPAPTLTYLSRTFDLSPFHQDLLLLCLGCEMLPEFARLLLQYFQQPDKTYPTLGLALALPSAQLDLFTPQNPLFHWRLLHLGPQIPLTQASLHLDPRILAFLLALPAQDAALEDLIHPIVPSTIPLSPRQQHCLEHMETAWFQEGSWIPLQLNGADPIMGQTMASHLCQRQGWDLYRLPAAAVPVNASDRHTFLRHWHREFLLTTAVLLLDWNDIPNPDPAQQSAILHLIETIQTPIIISTRERQAIDRRTQLCFDIPHLTHTEQQRLWADTLGENAPALQDQIEQIVAQFNLTPPIIQSTAQQFLALQQATPDQPEESATTPLWQLCRIQARPRLNGLAQRIDPTATLDNLVLPEPQKAVILDICRHLRQRQRVYQDWGFSEIGQRGLGITGLFHGESGTGKTLAAEVLAQEFDLDLYRIDLSMVVSKYIGETEKNLRQIFMAAEAGGAILLFDEADALFGKRTTVKDSHDRHANVEVSYLLQCMEAYQGLAILTTNLKDNMDVAFLRRIRFVVEFPFPKADARIQIWQRIFPTNTPTDQLDYSCLGQLNVTGGTIRNIALHAAFRAADANEPIQMHHIHAAAQAERCKSGRTLFPHEVSGWYLNTEY